MFTRDMNNVTTSYFTNEDFRNIILVTGFTHLLLHGTNIKFRQIPFPPADRIGVDMVSTVYQALLKANETLCDFSLHMYL